MACRAKSQKKLEVLASFVHEAGNKLQIKGSMTAEAAHRAVDTCVDAIVVSNPGGRVLEHCPARPKPCLPFAGTVCDQIHIFVGGGIRTGVDVLNMLALGAKTVLIGRPVSVTAIGGCFEGGKDQFTLAMLLTGCASLSDIDGRLLYCG